MQKKAPNRAKSLQREYERLSRSLAGTGYISQGSVLDRATLHPRRAGYQWTRKLAQKTVTVALSREQFYSLRKAIENRRKLQKTLTKMENLSRKILFQTLPDTSRRKPLPRKALGIL
jgi:hypothetical protein